MATSFTLAKGGRGGKPFDDAWVASCLPRAPITAITVQFDKYVHNITVEYGPGTRVSHGRGCHNSATLRLAPGEHVTRVDGRSGGLVDRLTLHTSAGRVLGPCGGPGGRPFSFKFGANRLSFLTGRAGHSVDALCFAYMPVRSGDGAAAPHADGTYVSGGAGPVGAVAERETLSEAAKPGAPAKKGASTKSPGVVSAKLALDVTEKMKKVGALGKIHPAGSARHTKKPYKTVPDGARKNAPGHTKKGPVARLGTTGASKKPIKSVSSVEEKSSSPAPPPELAPGKSEPLKEAKSGSDDAAIAVSDHCIFQPTSEGEALPKLRAESTGNAKEESSEEVGTKEEPDKSVIGEASPTENIESAEVPAGNESADADTNPVDDDSPDVTPSSEIKQCRPDTSQASEKIHEREAKEMEEADASSEKANSLACTTAEQSILEIGSFSAAMGSPEVEAEMGGSVENKDCRPDTTQTSEKNNEGEVEETQAADESSENGADLPCATAEQSISEIGPMSAAVNSPEVEARMGSSAEKAVSNDEKASGGDRVASVGDLVTKVETNVQKDADREGEVVSGDMETTGEKNIAENNTPTKATATATECEAPDKELLSVQGDITHVLYNADKKSQEVSEGPESTREKNITDTNTSTEATANVTECEVPDNAPASIQGDNTHVLDDVDGESHVVTGTETAPEKKIADTTTQSQEAANVTEFEAPEEALASTQGDIPHVPEDAYVESQEVSGATEATGEKNIADTNIQTQAKANVPECEAPNEALVSTQGDITPEDEGDDAGETQANGSDHAGTKDVNAPIGLDEIAGILRQVRTITVNHGTFVNSIHLSGALGAELGEDVHE